MCRHQIKDQVDMARWGRWIRDIHKATSHNKAATAQQEPMRPRAEAVCNLALGARRVVPERRGQER